MNAALVIIGLATLGALALGVAAHRGVRMTLEQWTVAGRGFGGLLVFLLTAGEIYTTFTFLGGSGWAYGRGAPTYYSLASTGPVRMQNLMSDGKNLVGVAQTNDGAVVVTVPLK